MKILLLKDVYKLGRAGDVKKVANGYGRNYLIPQGLAVLATDGALKQIDHIREEADKQRSILNEELSGLAEQLGQTTLNFPVRASETGRLYGSVNTRMISEELSNEIGEEISHRQIDAQPLRMIGKHVVGIRLTVDLVPEVDIVVYREGESPEAAIKEAEILAEAVEKGEIDMDEKPRFDYEDELDAEEAETEAEPEADHQAEEPADTEVDAETEVDADTEEE